MLKKVLGSYIRTLKQKRYLDKEWVRTLWIVDRLDNRLLNLIIVLIIAFVVILILYLLFK